MVTRKLDDRKPSVGFLSKKSTLSVRKLSPKLFHDFKILSENDKSKRTNSPILSFSQNQKPSPLVVVVVVVVVVVAAAATTTTTTVAVASLQGMWLNVIKNSFRYSRSHSSMSKSPFSPIFCESVQNRMSIKYGCPTKKTTESFPFQYLDIRRVLPALVGETMKKWRRDGLKEAESLVKAFKITKTESILSERYPRTLKIYLCFLALQNLSSKIAP